MSIYDSKLWILDIDEIIKVLPEINELSGTSIMITGSTGLICSAVIDVLIRWNVTHNEKIKIFAAGRSEQKVIERFAPYVKEPWFSFVQYDASSIENVLNFSCDYIVHGASNASPNMIVREPVETMLSNFIGIKSLLNYAREKNIKKVLYISSSEVYGKKEHSGPNKICEYGGIDTLNSRNAYSIGKCAAETMCISYFDEYDVESVIVRPGHIYGPTAKKSDNRVSSEWAIDAAKGKDIVMKSNGSQIRSYCYCLDCASAILLTLLKGEVGRAYNISNSDSIINIREMAEILAKVAGVQLKKELPSETDKKEFNPMDNSSLDNTELLKIGWKGLFNAERGLSHTVTILREINQQ